MANTFGILAVLVLAFSAFVAYKNQEEHKTQIENTKTQEKNRDRNTNTFNTLLTETTDLEEQTVSTQKTRDDFQAKLKLQNEENKAIEASIAEKEEELEKVKEKVAAAKDELKELGDLRSLAGKIEALKSSVAQLEDDVKVLEAENSQLRNEKSSTANRSADLAKILRDRNAGRSLPTLKTSVSRISSTLGFVTLAGGDAAGVVTGSTLDVKRGSDTIAQLKVTAVSKNSATADIIASSVVPGESVSVGDRVVATEEEEKK